MSGALRFAAGLVLRSLLRVTTGRAEPAGRPARQRRPRRATAVASRRTTVARAEGGGGSVADAPARSRALLGLMIASLVVGLPLMLLFENTYTRIVGVLAIFTFIISGVFAIADPRLIERDDEDVRS